jgi:hypothetical protein
VLRNISFNRDKHPKGEENIILETRVCNCAAGQLSARVYRIRNRLTWHRILVYLGSFLHSDRKYDGPMTMKMIGICYPICEMLVHVSIKCKKVESSAGDDLFSEIRGCKEFFDRGISIYWHYSYLLFLYPTTVHNGFVTSFI